MEDDAIAQIMAITSTEHSAAKHLLDVRARSRTDADLYHQQLHRAVLATSIGRSKCFLLMVFQLVDLPLMKLLLLQRLPLMMTGEVQRLNCLCTAPIKNTRLQSARTHGRSSRSTD